MSNIKVVIFDLGGVLFPSPIESWNSNFKFKKKFLKIKIILELESDMGLQLNSIKDTLFDIKELFYDLERGEITLDDFENIFTYFYNKKVIYFLNFMY